MGEATKFSRFLSDSEKRYEAVIVLGWRSSTGDSEGDLEIGRRQAISDDELSRAIDSLIGEIDQIPPMYSAVKVAGTRLYHLARQGISVDRSPRKVTIREFRLMGRGEESLQVSVVCSKGTYIRALAEELGERLGCGGYLGSLRRTGVGPISSDGAIGFEALEALAPHEKLVQLRSVDSLAADLSAITLDRDEVKRLQHGLAICRKSEAVDAELFRIYDEEGRFFGIAEAQADGRLRAKRLVSQRYWEMVSP